MALERATNGFHRKQCKMFNSWQTWYYYNLWAANLRLPGKEPGFIRFLWLILVLLFTAARVCIQSLTREFYFHLAWERVVLKTYQLSKIQLLVTVLSVIKIKQCLGYKDFQSIFAIKTNMNILWKISLGGSSRFLVNLECFFNMLSVGRYYL